MPAAANSPKTRISHGRPAKAAGASHAAILFVTSIGLLIAHQLAFRLSARLAHGKLASEHAELLAAQLIGGLAVTVVAVH